MLKPGIVSRSIPASPIRSRVLVAPNYDYIPFQSDELWSARLLHTHPDAIVQAHKKYMVMIYLLYIKSIVKGV